MKTESLSDRMNADSAESIPKRSNKSQQNSSSLSKDAFPYAKLAILKLVKTESFKREVKLILET